jgi:hypothetical protein
MVKRIFGFFMVIYLSNKMRKMRKMRKRAIKKHLIKNQIKGVLFLLATLLLSTLSSAIVLADPPTQSLDFPPPQKAFAACQEKPKGTACTIDTPDEQLMGSCAASHSPQLICIVTRHQHKNNTQEKGQRLEHDMTRPPPLHKQGGRRHTTTQSKGVKHLMTADKAPITKNIATMKIQGTVRIIRANGVAEHLTGHFPNKDNPHKMYTQKYEFRVPAYPQLANKITPLKGKFGVAVNGVPFDPVAMEWYQGNPDNDWRYEALSGALSLGLDENYAHVQRTGAYHYHGLPTLLMKKLKVQPEQHSAVIGWAADGFPIFALYGYKEGEKAHSGVIENTSSYRIKLGNRSDKGNPLGG